MVGVEEHTCKTVEGSCFGKFV